MNAGVLMHLQDPDFESFFDEYPEEGTLDHMLVLFLIFF
jgi:hypothetical protein